MIKFFLYKNNYWLLNQVHHLQASYILKDYNDIQNTKAILDLNLKNAIFEASHVDCEIWFKKVAYKNNFLESKLAVIDVKEDELIKLKGILESFAYNVLLTHLKNNNFIFAKLDNF